MVNVEKPPLFRRRGYRFQFEPDMRRSFVFRQWRHEQLASERRDPICVKHGVDTVLGSCHALHDRRPPGDQIAQPFGRLVGLPHSGK